MASCCLSKVIKPKAGCECVVSAGLIEGTLETSIRWGRRVRAERAERFHSVRPLSVFLTQSLTDIFRKRERKTRRYVYFPLAGIWGAFTGACCFGSRGARALQSVLFPAVDTFQAGNCPVWLLDHGRRRRPLRRRLRAVRGHWEVSVTLGICYTPLLAEWSRNSCSVHEVRIVDAKRILSHDYTLRNKGT